MHSNQYNVNHVFHSHNTNSSWMIVAMDEQQVKIRDLAYKPNDMPYRTPDQFEQALAVSNHCMTTTTEKFEEAIGTGKIDFSKHAYQNKVIDGMMGNKDTKAEYAKNKHWGGTR